MENEITGNRRLIIILVIVTVAIFIGLIWLIAIYKPWDMLGLQSPSSTASQHADRNCTYPLAYWKAHPELYPSQVVIGGIVYKERELEALLSDDSQETAQQIKTQLAVAFLNNLAGADQSSIETTIFEAYGWLMQHPVGNPAAEDEQEAGRRLYAVLLAYNLGLVGVEPCERVSSITETSTSTGTATMAGSLIPGQTNTPTTSETPTPTGMVTEPIGTLTRPSRTPVPTTARPESPGWTPTRTSPPLPSNTPTPQPPTLTKTPVPATNTFTPPPPPTATYTQPPSFAGSVSH